MRHIKKFESSSMNYDYIKMCFINLVDDFDANIGDVWTLKDPDTLERTEVITITIDMPRLTKRREGLNGNNPGNYYKTTGLELSHYIEVSNRVAEMYSEIEYALSKVKLQTSDLIYHIESDLFQVEINIMVVL